MRIWYTKGFGNTAEAIRLIRADPAGAGFTLVAGHTDPGNPVARAAHAFIREPEREGAAYADWLLRTARRRGIGHVVVQRHPSAVAAARGRFAAAGIGLSVAATPEVLALLADKHAFQTDLARPEVMAAGVHGHRAIPFSSVAEFDAATEELRPAAPHGLCVKPVRGIYGSGFRRIEEDDRDLERILSADPANFYRLSRRAFRAALASARKVPRMILMPYLPGVERSVDFAASRGRVLAAVCRVKKGGGQRIELKGPSIEAARVLAARYRLDGMNNLQTRECDGAQVVLEINPRMSGGMAMACLSGLNLPLIALLGGLGRSVEGLPRPRGGLMVGMARRAAILGEPDGGPMGGASSLPG